MNKTLLKVLKYVGVGCIGAVVGIGALIGVSKCSYNQEDHVENSNKYKMASASSGDVTFTYDDIYSPSFLSCYEQTLERFGIEAGDWSEQEFHGTMILGGRNSVILDMISLEADGMFFRIDSASDYYNGEYWIDFADYDNCFMRTYDSSDRTQYDDIFVTNSTWFPSYPSLTLVAKDETYDGSPTNYQFFVVLRSLLDGDDHYTKIEKIRISDVFNYNILAQNDYYEEAIDIYSLTPYITKTPPVSAEDGTRYYEMPIIFTARGIQWSGMRSRFDVVTASEKLQTSDNQLVSGVGNLLDGDRSDCYAFTFVRLDYYRYVNGVKTYLTVAERIYNKYDERDAYYPYKATWLNDEYRTLYYRYGEINEFQEFQNDTKNIDFLVALNNNLSNYQSEVIGGDVGLGNVFELIGQAFTGLVPILGITIVPGITIGLLMFLPLFTGIIIFIIWLVKR